MFSLHPPTANQKREPKESLPYGRSGQSAEVGESCTKSGLRRRT
jgi:hypothetical protein